MSLADTHARFDDTQWTILGALRSGDAATRNAAIERLVRIYLGPVYGFLRREGLRPHEADDATQSFFAQKVLEGGLFLRADRSRGSLRALIATALRNFLHDRHRREVVRGAGRTVSLEAIDLAYEEAVLSNARMLDPGEQFERRWMMSVVDEALRRTEAVCRSEGREWQWRAFDLQRLRPLAMQTERPSHAQVAQDLGRRDANEISGAIRLVVSRLLSAIGEIVAENTDDPAEYEAEFRRIRRFLGLDDE